MAERILALDDDIVTLELIKEILSSDEFDVKTFTSPLDALDSFKNTEYDLILSDYFMPQMNGGEYLKEIRKIDRYIPFVFMTVNMDIKIAINLMKNGADDYICKPIEKEELGFRIAKTIEVKRNKKIIDRIEKERIIREKESQLSNWKSLYALKDIKQTKQFIDMFSRTVNQAGAFIWLDILKSNIEKIDEKQYKIGSKLVNLIIESTEKHKELFDQINFIIQLDDVNLDIKKIGYSDFLIEVEKYVKTDLSYLYNKYKRKLIFNNQCQKPTAVLKINMSYLYKIIKELIINAIKYSPKGTDIHISLGKNHRLAGENIDITIINKPRKMQAKDIDGNTIFGVPYEYSELVFDLFYTIEKFPNYLDEEDWSDGLGLYVCRKLINRQNGWISAVNGVDYTRAIPQPFMKYTITLPCMKKV